MVAGRYLFMCFRKFRLYTKRCGASLLATVILFFTRAGGWIIYAGCCAVNSFAALSVHIIMLHNIVQHYFLKNVNETNNSDLERTPRLYNAPRVFVHD